MVGNQELHDKHPELFHYTNRNGVVGILTSQNLRATHYRFLNDTTELQLMRGELAERLLPFVEEEMVAQYQHAGENEKNEIDLEGGAIAIARKSAIGLAEATYESAFENTQSGSVLAVPYITSFCTHTDDQPYERKNGLLSQWRGYARGGYAIVFDTKKLCAMYQTDAQNYYYSAPCHISDVVYQGDEEFFNEEFGESIGKIIEVFRKLRATGEIQAGEIFGDIVSIFTRLKHTGFFEEREVRAVAFPVTNEIEEGYRSVNPDYVSPDLALKPIHIREDGVPYIETLNHSDGTRLPIKRIIIGPQEEQNRAKAVIDHLVADSGIEVHCSETPLSW